MKLNLTINKFIESLDLQIDESYRGNCPECYGKNTFTVTKTATKILYNCYKLNCSLRGNSSYNFTVMDEKNRREKQRAPDVKFSLPTYVVNKLHITKNWGKQYGIENAEMLYDVKENRIVFPVLHEGAIVDATGRSINKKQKPKWKRYGTSGYAYTSGVGRLAVIVEDCISASVVPTLNCVFTGVALMGTSLLPNHIKQLQEYDKILVALDPDAVNKTVEFTRQLRSSLPSIKIHAIKLEDDLKYRINSDVLCLQKYIR